MTSTTLFVKMKSFASPLPVIVAAAAALGAAAVPTASATYLNVYGEELQPCSSSGQALTGYLRNGSCTALVDDSGSHHICIDLSSTSGGNFCSVTGQPDWCSSEMPCHHDQSMQCQVHNWCVCQWAFASYIEKAGGCDKIQDLNCSAINMEAIKAYRSSAEEKHAAALQCLESRCNLASVE